MTGTIATYPAALLYEVAFNAAPNQAFPPPWYTDLSARTTPGEQDIERGRQYELDVNQAGTWNTALQNTNGALDATNGASPYAPGVVPYRPCRIRGMLGANALTADQATAGDAAGYLGAIPAQFNVGNDAGFPVSIVSSGSAYQGSRVYQAVVPSGLGAGTSVLLVTSVPVVPGTAYSLSAQVRIPSGTSTATSLQIVWFDQGGNQLAASTVTGGAATPTSGSSTWTALGASGSAPSAALSASLRVQIDSGSTAAATTWQIDAAQWESSSTVTAFQVPGTLGANLLPQPIATGSASINRATDSAAAWFTPVTGSVAQALNLAPAPTGHTTALAWTSPPATTSASPLYAGVVASGAPSSAGPVADCAQVAGSTQYTASLYLTRAASADATVQVTAAIRWFNAAGGVAGTTTGPGTTVPAGSWVRAAVTGTAPATAIWGRARIQVSSPASTTATNVLYTAAWQFEQSAVAGAWADPGPARYAFSGLVERWPQTWTMSGTYGVARAVAVDALAGLAQYTVQDPLIGELLALGASFLYPLNELAGSGSCADKTGRRAAAPVENSPFGVGSVTFGNSITSATAAGAFIGSSGPVATFNNNATQSSTGQFAETFISLHKATPAPGPPTSGGWTRLIAFRAAAAPGTNKGYTLWDTRPPSWTANASLVSFALDNLGHAELQWSDFSGAAAWAYGGTSNLCDGNWHLLAIGVDPVAGAVIWVDGAVVSTGPPGGNVTGIATDVLGCLVSTGSQQFEAGLIGDLALAAEVPFLLSSAQMTNLYGSWKSASSGESSGARAKRLLAWVGWNGPTQIDTGQTTNMGPATDLVGASALDALDAVALTENGNAFASAVGAVTFTSRARRYNQLLPAYVFGENAQFGEWPYADLEVDYDPAHLFNTVQVTQSSTGQVFTAQDAASQLSYFPRLLQRAINPGAANEAQDAATYLLSQYRSARLRIANLTLHAAAIPGLFGVCLALEIGTRIRVMRRPPGAPAIRFDGFVESISWSVDPESGEVVVILQCSPADLASYWLLAALRTVLNTQAAAGQNQATINALPDSAVNALASSLPQGYQLAFEPGTPRAETMTLTATGIPATAPGYTTATLTFTSNFAFTHAANAVVCEPLPVNVTDPATYDAASVLGAASCTVLSGGASGTNTITVGPLADAAVNALGSVWNVGDLLWISPGAAAFEGYNLLHPNAATAGEGVLPIAAGAAGGAYGVGGFYAAPLVAASATAFQGANVWAAAVAGAAATGHTLINIGKAAVAPLLAFTWSIYVRSATSGQNPTVTANLQWLDASGASLGSATGAGVALTGSPTATWTRLTVSGAAPAGAVWASPSVLLTTAPALAWSFQADALQLEQAAAASVFCATPQVKSVAASVPGYASVQITLNTNLINSHAAGDVVCDPLPAGVTSPAAVGATARLAY